MHYNTANRVLKEIKIAKQHLNDAVYTLGQSAHKSEAYGLDIMKALDILRDEILEAGHNSPQG